MNERKDEDLVRSCLMGNQQSFAELVAKYQKPLFNLAVRMTGSHDDAKDITQTSFIKAYENLSSYKHNYHFFSWLYRITINESINWLRVRKRFRPLREEILPEESQADKRSNQAELADLIQEGLIRIKLEYRTVIILRHFQELSYEEIAFILDLSVDRVKSRLFTARKLLKQVLIKMGLKDEK
ncbi:sigma-70 family RNA polymerase sigma factor [candidate division KSB1 bacterium]|nr:sigma-70 family RNA polymerase sigma factor [candidate division KSB1 bacterium]